MSKLSTTLKISDESIDEAKLALEKHGITVIIVENKEEALNLLKKQILASPEIEVMTGSSTTLIQIGFMDFYLSNNHTWKNIGTPIFQEQDNQKQYLMRRKSVTANYFIASVNAITQTGLLVAVDGTGSRVGAFPFGAEKIILVSGINKIVPTLDDAFERIRRVVFPLEDERAKKRYGHGTSFGKWVIVENEPIKDRFTLILVKEELGF